MIHGEGFAENCPSALYNYLTAARQAYDTYRQRILIGVDRPRNAEKRWSGKVFNYQRCDLTNCWWAIGRARIEVEWVRAE